MRLQYVGNRAYNKRLAEFSYTDEEMEQGDVWKILKELERVGYEVTTDAYMSWIVVADRDEFNQVKADYKVAKEVVRKRK